MKAIMMSIRPQYVAKILNGEKTIEIRKKFPKDFVGWVYIYCTKEKILGELIMCKSKENAELFGANSIVGINKGFRQKEDINLQGKVVARFWCHKVEEIKLNFAMRFFTKSMNEEELLKQSCLTPKELENYLLPNLCYGKAIHITKLEIFDKPKEISEFKVRRNDCPFPCAICNVRYCQLKRPPQSYMFIEV